jgi:hypothetical protein
VSWDIFVQQIPSGVDSVSDMPEDYVPGPLGTRESIISAIQRVAPGADFRDPTWGKLDGPGYSIEVNLGDHQVVTGFALHVRGGDLAVHVVHDILQSLGLRAFDPSSSSGIFDPGSASLDGLRRWREYRNRVLRESGT